MASLDGSNTVHSSFKSMKAAGTSTANTLSEKYAMQFVVRSFLSSMLATGIADGGREFCSSLENIYTRVLFGVRRDGSLS